MERFESGPESFHMEKFSPIGNFPLEKSLTYGEFSDGKDFSHTYGIFPIGKSFHQFDYMERILPYGKFPHNREGISRSEKFSISFRLDGILPSGRNLSIRVGFFHMEKIGKIFTKGKIPHVWKNRENSSHREDFFPS